MPANRYRFSMDRATVRQVSDDPDAAAVVRLLSEPARLKVFAALVLGERTTAGIATVTGLAPREAMVALRRLAAGGIVAIDGQTASPREDVFAGIARRTAVVEPPEDLGYTDARVAAVMRTFVRDGRLLGLPAQRDKRIAVLSHIAQSFEPGISYSETEVNSVLEKWAGDSGVDHVSLRRYLVDESLLRRVDGIYRRNGGWTDVSA
jgi:hypothetical protein